MPTKSAPQKSAHKATPPPAPEKSASERASSPGDVRRGPNGEAAYRMGPGVTAGDWFVIHHGNGGGYTDGSREGVNDWPDMVEDQTTG